MSLSHLLDPLVPSLVYTLNPFPKMAKGSDISFAVTEDHDVLSWGGGGMGASGHRVSTNYYDGDTQAYLEPKPIRDLVGEEISQVKRTRTQTHARRSTTLAPRHEQGYMRECSSIPDRSHVS